MVEVVILATITLIPVETLAPVAGEAEVVVTTITLGVPTLTTTATPTSITLKALTDCWTPATVTNPWDITLAAATEVSSGAAVVAVATTEMVAVLVSAAAVAAAAETSAAAYMATVDLAAPVSF